MSGMSWTQARALAKLMPDEQRAGQPRAVGDGDAVDVRPGRRRRPAQTSSRTGHDPAQVGPGGDLGHDPARRRVQGDLRGDDVADDAPAVLDEGDAGLVARRLDRQQERAAHAPSVGSPGVAGRWRAVASSARAQPRDALAHAPLGERLGGHDQRVLAVVAVVVRAQPDRPEAVLLVQPPGRPGWTAGPRASPRGRRDRRRCRGRRAAAARRCPGAARPGATAKVVMWASSTISHIPP